MRRLLFVSIPLATFCQQFFTQPRRNEASSDAFPAWYQMPPKPMVFDYGLVANQPSLHGISQANMNYQNYPSFGAYSPAYTELKSGATHPARRHPMGGHDSNAEILAAIKEVIAQFKASLDETGIDQDVRLMGNQLKNPWQQLRTAPMNEQLGRLIEKAVDDGNRTQHNKPQ